MDYECRKSKYTRQGYQTVIFFAHIEYYKIKKHFHVSHYERVEMVLYNLLGQKLRVLVNQRQEAGKYRLTWNGDSEQGQLLPSGIYFLRLRAGRFVADRKLLLLK